MVRQRARNRADRARRSVGSAGGASVRFAGASGQPTRAGSAQATLSAWVLWTSTPSPRVEHLGLRAPPLGEDRTGRLDLLGDVAALHRHQRTLGATSGMDHWSRRSRGATARDVTTSNVALAVQGVGTAAHHLDVGQGQGRPTTSSRKVVRRSSGSTRVDPRSGRAMASTRPGKPGPGADVAHGGALRHHLAQDRAVEQVPVPQPGGLPRDRSGPGPRRRWPGGRRTPPPGAGARTRTPSRPRRAGRVRGCEWSRRSRGSFHVKQA